MEEVIGKKYFLNRNIFAILAEHKMSIFIRNIFSEQIINIFLEIFMLEGKKPKTGTRRVRDLPHEPTEHCILSCNSSVQNSARRRFTTLRSAIWCYLVLAMS